MVRRLAVADADVAVFDVVADRRRRARHVVAFAEHGHSRVIGRVSLFQDELPETRGYSVGDLHRAALVPVAFVDGVLRLVLRVFPERPAGEERRVVAPAAVDLATEGRLRQAEL